MRCCVIMMWFVEICVPLQDIVLDFSPGPIHAVDGDKGLNSPLSYSIISGNIHTTPTCLQFVVFVSEIVPMFVLGDDDGHFLMDRETGEVKLIRGVRDRLATPELHLHVMVRYYKLSSELERYTYFSNSQNQILCCDCGLYTGVSGRWPQEVLHCYSVGPSSGGEPVLSGVWQSWISRLCNRREELCLFGSHIWQQSTYVTCARPRLQPCMH